MSCPNCNSKTITKELKYRTITFCEYCDYFTIENLEECCRQSDYQFRKYKNTDGSYTLRKQCPNCGHKHSKIHPKSEVKNFEGFRPFDENLEKREIRRYKRNLNILFRLKDKTSLRDMINTLILKNGTRKEISYLREITIYVSHVV